MIDYLITKSKFYTRAIHSSFTVVYPHANLEFAPRPDLSPFSDSHFPVGVPRIAQGGQLAGGEFRVGRNLVVHGSDVC